MAKRIGLLYGMERTFPAALSETINARAGGEVVCEPVNIGAQRVDVRPDYDVILDRISHEVPFYRTFLKQCCINGIHVVNNPFWFAADDKHFGNLVAMRAGVAIPRSVLLPSKDHPTDTEAASFSNLRFPLDWDEVFSYLGFPIYLKPSDGGGWKHVYRCENPEAFFEAYQKTETICMMAQEEIVFTQYYRCYVLGREHVHLMEYNPKAALHEQYVRDPAPIEPALEEKLKRDCLALCDALGYDFNTVELAVRDGVPFAIDFTNPCPDAERASVGDDNFAWIVDNAANFLIDRALHPRPFEMTGTWPERIG